MGFRCSFYHYPIKYLENIRNHTYDVDDCFYFEWENTDKHQIAYDMFTDSVLSVCNNPEFCTPVFDNLRDDEEFLYVKMNKGQFKNFIKHVLTNFVKYRNNYIIPIREFDKLKDELKDGYKSDTCANRIKFENLKVIDKIIYNQQDYNYVIQSHAADVTFFDEMIENKWKVSMGWHTELGIANLIHIYHMMDWDNEEIVIFGG